MPSPTPTSFPTPEPSPTATSTTTTAPTPTPVAIDITPVGSGVSITSEDQIIVQLRPDDVVPANLFDLAGRSLVFTPDGSGGYSRAVRPLDWDDEIGNAVNDNEEIEPGFPFEFAGRQWDSLFVSRYGLVTFGEPYPFSLVGPDRFGTMAEIAQHLGAPPMIAALYKPQLGGLAEGDVRYVSRRPDRVVVTWFSSDPGFYVHGVPPQEKNRFQMALHADGRIALHYALEPDDPDEAIRDGIVGLFSSGVVRTGLLGSISDPEDRDLPGHLDLVETAVYTTSEPNLVLIEFTTRAPIHPVPGQELIYMVELDVDEPFTRERDDRDLLAGVTVLPEGRRELRWDAARAASGTQENRIGLLVDLQAIAARSASVSVRTRTRDPSNGAWAGGDRGRPTVLMFPEVAASAPTDLSQPDSWFSPLQAEVFHYPSIRDRGEGIADVSCRIIEVLGDEFDFLAFNSQSRVDRQEPGPAHGIGGFYRENIHAEVQGIGLSGNGTTPCRSRLKNTWGFPVWIKADTVVNENYAADGHRTPYDKGLTYFAHEIAHTWLAYASYQVNGEPVPMQVASGESHWGMGLHAPAPFPWTGPENGSVMGGSYWKENPDGTFTPTSGWRTMAGGFSWLDLYLMGLATPGEVPDMFILRNLRQVTSDWRGPYAADKETITIDQIIAAIGPRNPPQERARNVFNTGFVYFLVPGETLGQEMLRAHAGYRDRALEHWSHITGGRGQLTSELP